MSEDIDLDDFENDYDDGDDHVRRDGYVRRVFADDVHWAPAWIFDDEEDSSWSYGVMRLPFVPEYLLVEYHDDEHGCYESVLSGHKTLTEAMGILKVLLATPGAVRTHD